MLEKHVWRDFAAVTFSVAVLGIGLGSTLPLTALAISARGFGPDVVGWIVAASALGGVVGTLAAPAATLRLGRRSVMLCCVALAASSVISLQYITSLSNWAALRFVFGASMAPLFVLGEAWINVLPSDAVRGRVVAIYTTSFTVCQILGRLLAYSLSHHGQSAFIVCGCVFLLGAPGIALARDDAGPITRLVGEGPSGAKDASSSWLSIMRKVPAIVAGTTFFATFDSVILSFLPLFALDHGFSRHRALAAAAVVLAGDATLQFAAGWLADHYARARVQLFCSVAMCVMLPLLPFLIHVPVLWEVYLYLLGGVAGSVYTLSIVASGERFSGAALLRASGLIGIFWNVGSSLGSAATGVAMRQFGNSAITVVLWVMAVVVAFAAACEVRQWKVTQINNPK